MAYRGFMRLRLPIPATSLGASLLPQRRTKLTATALEDLFSLFQECANPCHSDPKTSGHDSLTT